MIVSPVAGLLRNLGIQTVVNEISKKEKFLRKKYTGVFKQTLNSFNMMLKVLSEKSGAGYHTTP